MTLRLHRTPPSASPAPIDLDTIGFSLFVGQDPRWPSSNGDSPAATIADGPAIRPTQATSEPSPPPDVRPRLISREELATEQKCSTKTIDRRRQAGELPAPVINGGRAVCWDRDELDRWRASGSPPRDEWERIERTEV